MAFEVKPAAQPIYMVVGVPASGKSWVCSQLADEFFYVAHDAFMDTNKYLEAIRIGMQMASKPLLIETPFSVSQILEPLQKRGYRVHPVFIIESDKTLETRYRTRENKPIPTQHLSRQRTYAERAQKLQAFSGTSGDVLRYLQHAAGMGRSLQVRESNDGRHNVPTRGDAYDVGDKVVGRDGAPGIVVSVGEQTFVVQFADADVKFPVGTEAIRRPWPWE